MDSYARDNNTIITVLDFDASGISKFDVKVFVDYLTSQIVETNKYIVIDRMEREAILDEIEFSNQDCADEKCQLEIGKLLSANQLILGSMGKVGNRYILNIRIVAVETGETQRSVSERYNSISELVDGSRLLVSRLIDTEIPFRIEGKTETAVRKEDTKAKEFDNLIIDEKQPDIVVQVPLSPIVPVAVEKKREYYIFRGEEYKPIFFRGYSSFLHEIEKEAISNDLRKMIGDYSRSHRQSRTVAVFSAMVLAMRIPWQIIRFKTTPSTQGDVNRWIAEFGTELLILLVASGLSSRPPREIVRTFNEEMF
jgi:hypothetical protein